jgi:WD40 repeat protein
LRKSCNKDIFEAINKNNNFKIYSTEALVERAERSDLHTLQGHTLSVKSAAFSPNGSLVVTASWDNTAKIWDAQTGQCLRTLQGHTYSITSAVFSPDGSLLATASYDGTAKYGMLKQVNVYVLYKAIPIGFF